MKKVFNKDLNKMRKQAYSNRYLLYAKKKKPQNAVISHSKILITIYSTNNLRTHYMQDTVF